MSTARHLLRCAAWLVLAACGMLSAPALAEGNDEALKGRLNIDRLEAQRSTLDQTDFGYWLADGWVGSDTNKLVFRSEGTYLRPSVVNSLTQALYGRSIEDDWILAIGAARSGSSGSSKDWLDLSVEGDLPFGIDSEWMLFWSRDSHAWLKTDFETAVALGGAWKFVPRLELNFHSKNDPVNQIGTGLSDGELSLRLAYGFAKQVAGYVGYSHYQTFGGTARQLRDAGGFTFDHVVIAGLMISL